MSRVWKLACLLVALLALTASALRADKLAAPEEPAYRAWDRAAVEAYRKGDVESARNAWERCLAAPELQAAPEEKGRILYDLGNCAYRQKHLFESIGWYTAALRERPRDEDTWANLEQARSEAHLEPADRGDLLATLERVFTSLTLAEARCLALLALLGWALVLGLEAFVGGRLWAWAARLSTLALVVALVPWQIQSARAGERNLLVISSEPAPLSSEPREDAAHLSDLAPGEVGRYLDELPEWTKIGLAGERTGWVKKSALFELWR